MEAVAYTVSHKRCMLVLCFVFYMKACDLFIHAFQGSFIDMMTINGNQW